MPKPARRPRPRLLSLVLLLLGGATASPLRPFQHQQQQPHFQPPQENSEQEAVLGGGQRLPSISSGAAAPRRLHGKFLHITDLHPDEFYKVHSSTAEGAACHRGKGSAGAYGAETSDCDAPYALINATFDWIAKNIRDDIDFVIWTGDSARHDSDEAIPRSPDQVYGSNQRVADKFVEVFSDASGKSLVIPVVPTLGNNDILPHNVLPPGPNKRLKRYADIWGRFVPQEQMHSFEYGGWFYVEVIPNHLAVFNLNTLYFFDRNAGVDDCVRPSEPGFKQFEWLRVQLQFMRERGVKVILMGHVPPARTGSKQLWDETCWQKYTLWLRQYRDVVVGAFFGHMNIDHFLLHDTRDIDYALLGVADPEDEPDADTGGGHDEAGDGPVALKATATPSRSSARTEEEYSILSTTDYLQELRAGWSKLPKPPALGSAAAHADVADDVEPEKKKTNKKKKKKNKKKKGSKLPSRWAERYQLSLVSPSVVPNYFPTIRVVEYNISGLEDVPVWADEPAAVPTLPDEGVFSWSGSAGTEKKGKKKKGKKGGKDKDKKKKPDKGLVVPDGPAKSAPPGPAYSPQPLSLRGYTQYFANLTHINNDMADGLGDTTAAAEDAADDNDGQGGVEADMWREGAHGDKPPKRSSAKPHYFAYDVEYSTFTDKVYNLTDLSVSNFLRLAYRMGQKSGSTALETLETLETLGSVSDSADVAVYDEGEVFADDESGDPDDVGGDSEKKKKKKKKKKKAKNKVWLHFLRNAFVGTVSEDELKKIASN